MGFLGFGNYDKPGPGIPKDAPKKKGVKLFFDVYIRAFWELLKLNMLFVLCCLPAVALFIAVILGVQSGSPLLMLLLFCVCGTLVGPPCASMTKVTMLIVREKPFFIFGDFKDAMKENLKHSLLLGLLLGFAGGLLGFSAQFYFAAASQNQVFYVIGCITVLLGFLLALAYVFLWPILVTMDLPLRAACKNSFLLGIACLKHSLPALLVVGAFGLLIFLFFPFTIVLLPVWFFSFAAFVFSFAAWPGMQKYVVRDPNAPPPAEPAGAQELPAGAEPGADGDEA